jgi:putative transcriptional regulator
MTRNHTYSVATERGESMAENVKLIKFRESLGLSQKEMADLIDVSLSFYIKIEHGVRNPSFNFVKKFKRKFPDINIDEIFFSSPLHVECDYDEQPTGTTG